MLSSKKTHTFVIIVLASLLYLVCYWISLYNYLFIIDLVIAIGVIAAFVVFAVAWNSRRFVKDDSLLFLGFGYLFIGCVELVNLLVGNYRHVEEAVDPAIHLQLSIAFQGALLLWGFQFFIGKKQHTRSLAAAMFLLTALLVLFSSFSSLLDVFGLAVNFAVFKAAAAITVLSVLSGAAVYLYRKRFKIPKTMLIYLSAALMFSALSILAFALQGFNDEFYGLAGHYARIVACYFVYRTIVSDGLFEPYEVLRRKISRSKDELSKVNRALQAISSCIKLIHTSDNRQEMLRDICRIVVEEGKYRMAWIGLAEKNEEKSISPVAWYGFEQGYLKTLEITWDDSAKGENPAGTAIRTDDVVVNQSILTNSRFLPWREEALKRGYASSVALPLHMEGTVMGVLNIYSEWANSFSENEIAPLMDLANEVSHGITSFKVKKDRYRFEQSLKESVDLMIIAQEIADLGYWSWDIQSGSVFWSNQVYKILGLDSTSVEPSVEQYWRCVHPDDLLTLKNSFQRALAGSNEVLRSEHKVLKADGSIHYVVNKAKITSQAVDGRPIYAIGTIQNITNRKRAGKWLQFQAQLLDAVKQSVIVTDVEKRVLYWNPFAEKLFGWSYDEAKNKLIGQLILTEETINEVPEIAKRPAQGDSWSGICTLKRRDNSTFTARVSRSPIVDKKNEITGIIEIASDITEQQRAVECLEVSEERFRKIVETAPSILAITDKKGVAIYISPNCESLTGFSQEQLKENFIRFVHDDEREKVHQTLISAFKNQSGEKNYEFKGCRKNGDSWYASASWEPLKDSNGRFTGFVIQTMDITEKKLAEVRIRESLKEKETLLQEIHHRVKNNMQVITSLLRFQSDLVDDEYLKKILLDSQSRVYSMAAVHESLYESDRLSEVDFRSYLTKIARVLFESFYSGNSKINLCLEIEDIKLDIEKASPLGLIVNELISNSLKHAFPAERDGTIEVRLERPDSKRMQLIVADNGIGLPEDLDWRNPKTLGFRLVTILGEDQLNGKVSLDRSSGTRIAIEFGSAADSRH